MDSNFLCLFTIATWESAKPHISDDCTNGILGGKLFQSDLSPLFFNFTFLCLVLLKKKVETKRGGLHLWATLLGKTRNGRVPTRLQVLMAPTRVNCDCQLGRGMAWLYGMVTDIYPCMEMPGLCIWKINLMQNTCFHGSSSTGELFFISYCTLGNKKKTVLTECIDSALLMADFYAFSRVFNALTSEPFSLWIYDMFPASLLLVCSPISLTWTTLKWHVDTYSCDESTGSNHMCSSLSQWPTDQPVPLETVGFKCTQQAGKKALNRELEKLLIALIGLHGEVKVLLFFQHFEYILGATRRDSCCYSLTACGGKKHLMAPSGTITL